MVSSSPTEGSDDQIQQLNVLKPTLGARLLNTLARLTLPKPQVSPHVRARVNALLRDAESGKQSRESLRDEVGAEER
jgi:hypothetical protein